MRTRDEINKDPRPFEALSLEVLLDIRDALVKPAPLYVKESGKPKRKRRTKKQMEAARRAKQNETP